MAEIPREDLICGVCKDLLDDPYFTPCCIKSFCRKHFPSSSSSSVPCPSTDCNKTFSIDNLVADNCRKKDSKKARAKLNARNSPKSQKSQDFAVYYQPQNVAMQTNTVGKKSRYNQNLLNVFSENNRNVEEQTHNSMQNFYDSNRNFGGQSSNFPTDRYQNGRELILDIEERRKKFCSECKIGANCIQCQHCWLYFCSECHEKHTLVRKQTDILKAAQNRLENLISDLLRLKEVENLRGWKHIPTAPFKNQEGLHNDRWIMDMLNKGDVKAAKRDKEVLEDDQRKVRELEEETVLGGNVKKISMVY
ncbi:unnamed protein product [Hymenolepis diminuta]|uniref:RING-type domain-containing protein n=1 Tax=Hymenolepis diminuta TaxID=6216 RepID=A0A0R3SQH1_HYMDI|nr:unnamed protein product [Hymenolepis diminuta]